MGGFVKKLFKNPFKAVVDATINPFGISSKLLQATGAIPKDNKSAAAPAPTPTTAPAPEVPAPPSIESPKVDDSIISAVQEMSKRRGRANTTMAANQQLLGLINQNTTTSPGARGSLGSFSPFTIR